MEVDGGSEGEDHKPNVNNNHSNKISNSNEGYSKPKRQMKTPFQLETLEKTYALDTYPAESVRAELSEKLGLSDRQLQMWFCHRRLKDKKDGPAKKQRKMPDTPPPPTPDSPIDDFRIEAERVSDYGSGSGPGSSPVGHMEMRNAMHMGVGDDTLMGRRYYEPSQSVIEVKAIACVEAQLGEPLREDGPILGIEFDPLPPDAFGAPISVEHHKRSGIPYEGKVYEQREASSKKAAPRVFHKYPFLQDQSSSRPDIYGHLPQSHFPNSIGEVPSAGATPFFHGNEQLTRDHGFHGHVSRVRVLSQQEKHGVKVSSPARDDDHRNVRTNGQFMDIPQSGPEHPYVLSDGHKIETDSIMRMERKRKSGDPRNAREAEANEIRIRRELEKQDMLRKKSEERMKKEMERQENERKKEEERLLRERQRELERLKREERRENERREKIMQKEHLRAEKMRQKEALRIEREAVRRKAAIEKATARRIARESMELIEDEQLELMEQAVASKELSSIICLDHDTLQNLESFQGFLGSFPPKSVRMKKPFGIEPWSNSEENVGNLLMVWSFLITFSDILELWPFTLDEFVQSFHDHESRLLAEIHVSLLRLIIKDVEDVARTPSTGLGMNQNGSANPGGGHLQIVEGAYAWGFDIRNWQQHLNPLTWPEIFRQLALSAGIGPQLKKRSVAWSDVHDKNEGKGCEDIISTLRNGSAAENAFTVMQEKGLLAPRKSRHRLTPGTVKFAAFHVLSLEGSKGLTVLELADKIQKSGLRDLTTSKTPEASISVALTRDTKLFERIAPSTYRVRSPYKKDPNDAEEILSEARKKIQIFQNGVLAEEYVNDVERDEESECEDVDDDPEVDDLAIPSLADKEANNTNEADTHLESGRENFSCDLSPPPENQFVKDFSLFPLSGPKDPNYPSIATEEYTPVDDITASNPDQENMEIDDSKAGESWVQGLTEGDYYDLSVEERLNALVALTGIANEGNSIRIVLEERLEAANALKKQMWAEAHLDKGRLREETITRSDFLSFAGSKPETQLNTPSLEGGQSPTPESENIKSEVSPSPAENQKLLNDPQSMHNHSTSVPGERVSSVLQDFSTGPDSFLVQQLGNASKRSRSQLKSYISHRAEEMYIYRSLPLGRDRRRNRYWQFVASASSNDPGSGRIFIELHDGHWRLIDTEEAYDALLMSLDTRGIRESHLRLMLQKIESSFKANFKKTLQCRNTVVQSWIGVKSEADEMGSSPVCPATSDSPCSTVCGSSNDTMVASSSFRVELGRNETEKKAAFKRYQEFQRWSWKECFNSSTLGAMKYGKKRCKQLLDICGSCLSLYSSEHSHCLSCRQTVGIISNDFDSSEHGVPFQEESKSNNCDVNSLNSSLPLGRRLLKALLSFIEASVPSEALQSLWTEERRKTWGVKLHMSPHTDELLQLLTLFEGVFKRDFLSSKYAATEEILGSQVHDPTDAGSILVLPWIPQTSAAVALRLFELDASIIYVPCEKPKCGPDDESGGEYRKFPIRNNTLVKNERGENEPTELGFEEPLKEQSYVDLKNARNSYKRGGRGNRDQARSKKLQKRNNGSKSVSARKNHKGSEKLSQGFSSRPLGQGTTTQVQGPRSRRTIRRREEMRAPQETLFGRTSLAPTYQDIGESLKESLSAEWDDENISNAAVHMKNDDDINNVEAMDSDDDDDDVGHAVGYDQENWELSYNRASDGWNEDVIGASDENVDVSEDDNDMVEEEVVVGGEEDSEEEDGDMSEEEEESDGVIPTRPRNGEDDIESAGSEDYSDDD